MPFDLAADRHVLLAAFVAVEWIIRIAMVVIVPFRRSPDAAKGWLLLILFEPILGLALYLVFGRRRLPAWRLQRAAAFRELAGPIRARLLDHPNVFHPAQDPAIAPGIHLAERLGEMPILGGNSVEVLSDYDGILDRLVADIDAARAHVHLLFYIIADDAVAGRVIAALERAAARGVACRVLADALGSRGVRFVTMLPKLLAAGIEASETMRVAFFRQRGARMDLRNHSKIAVIDGRIGYTGSLNLVDPNFKPGLTYEELMVRATGPVVLELQAIFAQDWYLETGKPLETRSRRFPIPTSPGRYRRRSCRRARSSRAPTTSG